MTEEKKNDLARRLAEALPSMRRALNLKQEELCEKTGISRSTLSGVERGKRKLYWDTFLTLMIFLERNEKSRQLVSACGIDLEELNHYLTV